MTQFTEGQGQILVSSDLLNRGIDIPSINVVINYDIPKDAQTYLHRIGRTGRFGLKSIAVTLITEEEYERLTTIQYQLKSHINHLPKKLL